MKAPRGGNCACRRLLHIAPKNQQTWQKASLHDTGEQVVRALGAGSSRKRHLRKPLHVLAAVTRLGVCACRRAPSSSRTAARRAANTSPAIARQARSVQAADASVASFRWGRTCATSTSAGSGGPVLPVVPCASTKDHFCRPSSYQCAP